MLAILLYIAITLLLIALWRRLFHGISRAAAVCLVLLPLCFTGRALLTGQVYAPIDLPFASEPLGNYAADYGIERLHNPGLSDLYMQIAPWQGAVRHALTQWEWPVWNPFLLCGTILAANMQAAPYDAVQLLGMLLPHAQALTFGAGLTFFLAGFFTFAFLRALGCSEAASLVAAAGYMFCALVAFFIAWPLGRVWTFLPLVLLSVRMLVSPEVSRLRSGAVLTTALVLTIFAGHPESVLHIVFSGVLYGLYRIAMRARRASAVEGKSAARRDALRTIGAALVCGVVALGLTAISLLPFFSVAPHTMEYRVRHEHYATAEFAIPPEQIAARAVASLLPFAGGRMEAPERAHNWDASSMRVGSIVLALAAVSLFLARRRRDTWFFLAFFLVMGCAGLNAFPVGDLLHALPLFDIALNERLGFAAVFALCVLAAFALDAWPAGRRDALGAAAVTLLIGIVTAGVATAVRDDEIAAGTDPAMIATLTLVELVPLALLAILFAVRIPVRYAIPLLLGLVLVQRTVADGAMYPTLPQKAFYPETPLLRHIRNDPATPFRTVGLFYALVPNTAALYGLEDPRGYEAMTFHRLRDTYDLWSRHQPVSFNIVEDKERPFLSFLNVKYAIGSLDAQPSAMWKQVLEDRQSRLFENTRVVPRAFVPSRIRYEPADEAVLLQMRLASEFTETAFILAPNYPSHQVSNGPGRLTTRRVGLGYEIEADMELDGWVILSESKWPGWRAYIDGHRIETHFANHAFVGVFVPKGKHHVRLVFQPEAFTRGRNITFTTIGTLLLFFGVRRWRTRGSQERLSGEPG